jgi:hypothetical protein
VKTIQRSIRALRKLGHVRVTLRANKSNHYYVDARAILDAAAVIRANSKTEKLENQDGVEDPFDYGWTRRRTRTTTQTG